MAQETKDNLHLRIAIVEDELEAAKSLSENISAFCKSENISVSILQKGRSFFRFFLYSRFTRTGSQL